MKNWLRLDFETRSSLNIEDCGLYNYATHPSTEPLMLAYKLGQQPVRLHEFRFGSLPDELFKALKDPQQVVTAFNSAFERYVLKYCLGIDIPASRFQDPQASARYLSLPADLETVGEVLNLPAELQKDKRGKDLIRLFSHPHTTKKKKGEEQKTYFNDWNSHPEEWKAFGEYCIQDVITEEEIARRLNLLEVFPLPEVERKIWILDQKINDRGIPVDIQFVKNALALAERSKKEALDIQNETTGLENANSQAQLLPWVRQRGYPFGTLRKDVIEKVLRDSEIQLTDECRKVLEKRREAGSTTYKKLNAILQRVGSDGRIRNSFIYMGSARCGRWSGSGVQLHNLSRPGVVNGFNFENTEVVDDARGMIYNNDYDGMKAKYGSPLLVIKNLIRTSFVAPEDEEFVISDLASIETRVGAYIAQCRSLLRVFEEGHDMYLDFATKLTGVPYEKLYSDYKSKDDNLKSEAKRQRQIAKPAVLGCFGLGTLVLTKRGYIPIQDVNRKDYIFDGVEWVRCGGAVYKGYKYVIELNGVKVTPEHEILIDDNEWSTAWGVNQDIQLEKRALNSAIGKCLRADIFLPNTDIFVGVNAEKRHLFLSKIWNLVRLKVVDYVQTMKRKIVYTQNLVNIQESLLTGSQIDTTPFFLDAEARVLKITDTAGEEYVANSKTWKTLYRMWLRSKTLTKMATTWIEPTIMEIMPRETSVLLLPQLTTLIKRSTVQLNIKERFIPQLISGSNMHLDIETLGMSLEKYEKDSPPNRLLRSNQNVEAHTYDILNCGPRNRFIILTSKGPLIVHNSIYRLGPGGWGTNKHGDKVKTGLFGYSDAMGINISEKQAFEITQIFRNSYPEICQCWYALEEAVAEVLNGKNTVRHIGPNDCIKIDKLHIRDIGDLLRIQLPSGRRLHYMNARIEETLMPWKKDGQDVYKPTLIYDGLDQDTHQWSNYITSHGGKIFENVVQGFSRDVLAFKIEQIESVGVPICAHVHDEPVGLRRLDEMMPGAEEVEAIMCQSINWAPGLLLGAEAFTSQYYRK